MNVPIWNVKDSFIYWKLKQIIHLVLWWPSMCFRDETVDVHLIKKGEKEGEALFFKIKECSNRYRAIVSDDTLYFFWVMGKVMMWKRREESITLWKMYSGTHNVISLLGCQKLISDLKTIGCFFDT